MCHKKKIWFLHLVFKTLCEICFWIVLVSPRSPLHGDTSYSFERNLKAQISVTRKSLATYYSLVRVIILVYNIITVCDQKVGAESLRRTLLWHTLRDHILGRINTKLLTGSKNFEVDSWQVQHIQQRIASPPPLENTNVR